MQNTAEQTEETVHAEKTEQTAHAEQMQNKQSKWCMQNKQNKPHATESKNWTNDPAHDVILIILVKMQEMQTFTLAWE